MEKLEQNESLIKNFERKFNKELWRDDTKATYIKEWVYSIESKEKNRIWFYIDIEWNNIASPVNERNDKNYLEKLEKLWYKEEKIWTEYIIIRLSDNSKVDKYSVEYFNIFSDFRYIDSIKYLDEALNSKNRLSRSQALELIPTFINAWSLKIWELASFLERWSITQEDFEKFLPKMRVLLKEQTIDERWNMKKFWKEVTEEEIKDYFQKWYIDQNLAKELYDIIKKRDEKTKEQNKVKKEAHSSLEIEKNEYMA